MRYVLTGAISAVSLLSLIAIGSPGYAQDQTERNQGTAAIECPPVTADTAGVTDPACVRDQENDGATGGTTDDAAGAADGGSEAADDAAGGTTDGGDAGGTEGAGATGGGSGG